MIFRSLRANLNLGLLVTIIVLAVVLWALIGIAVEKITGEYIQTRLEHDAESLLVASQFDNDGELILDEKKIQNIYHRPFSGHYFIIQAGDKTHYSRSLWDETLHVPKNRKTDNEVISHQRGPRNQSLLVRQQRYKKQGQELLIVTAEDVSHIATQIHRFRKQFGASILLIIIVLLAAQSAIIHFAMRPVRQAQQAIGRLESGQASQLPENVPAEVLPLVREVNRLLQRQQQRLERSRNAMGDVAHAIKTPLALIHQWYEGLDGSEQQRHAQVLQQIRQIQQRVDSELKRARLAGDRRSHKRFHLQQDLPPLLDTLERLYQDKSVALEVDNAEDVLLPLEKEDATELLGNLLDNAWKWANSRIRLTFSEQNERLSITIEDDGPGIDPQQAITLLQRGQRQDETVSGHGIGLSIVKQIVESYHGTLQLDRSPAFGGLRVIVQLPLFGGSD
ncbi:MAG: sensor histidine kinase [Thiohalophilus sp.]|uniref:sensor histidine kinase n=1 Tax=Thiohalophilus sp. TaxID=3028392 RepID=UPI0028707929|nr:sensor histidine kinase [Thiohalophilus sp.]MDR9437691.1 sensor histidine kinase [Thiohalophilus sp.]